MKTTTEKSKTLRSTLLAAAVAMACGSALAQQDPITDSEDTGSQTTQYPSDQPSLPTDPVPTEQPNDPMNQTGNPNDPTHDPVSPSDPLNQTMDQPPPPDRTMQGDPRPDSDLSQYETRENRADDPMTDEPQQAAADDQANEWSGEADGKALSEALGSENDLGEFVSALETAGLSKALSSGTEYTVFAPTDEAFKQFQEDKGEDWSAEENVEELREVLRSHVVSGKLDRAQLEGLDSAQVLTGSVVEVSSEGEELRIGDATVEGDAITTADNLTIYKIDGVLDPTAMSEQSAAAGTDASAAGEQSESQYGAQSEAGTQGEYGAQSDAGTQSGYDAQSGIESESDTESTAAGTDANSGGQQSDTSQPYDDTQQYESAYESEIEDEEEPAE
ncbi:MAG TPA: fasciclin domain-containing protein [Woeseiaceae bacterium]|nr:fasciclin domain-containing protein [Woeseiaceae bacterium]